MCIRDRNSGELIDRDAAWQAKRAALQLVYDAGLSPRRQRASDGYRDHRGRELDGLEQHAAIGIGEGVALSLIHI